MDENKRLKQIIAELSIKPKKTIVLGGRTNL